MNNESRESKENKNQNQNYKNRAESKDSNENNTTDKSFHFDNDSLILDDDNKDILHDLLENSFNQKNKNYYQFDLNKFKLDDINEKIAKMINKGIELIGEKCFKKIYDYYRTLQEVIDKLVCLISLTLI